MFLVDRLSEPRSPKTKFNILPTMPPYWLLQIHLKAIVIQKPIKIFIILYSSADKNFMANAEQSLTCSHNVGKMVEVASSFFFKMAYLQMCYILM